MNYQALYRKYRPSTFDDVIGQEIVIKTLKNSLKNGRISHAYMFSGPRGIGKTTIAKVLAKSINCLSPDNGNPCGKCKNCLSIQNNQCTDIIEIDAASNNGVDEIREIRSKINLVPTELKYKVYIIDEVHMLSIGAFNALLKTLEEPPAHIVFILATTDPHKVPVTIISRCQCFEFKRISRQDICSRLRFVCDYEKISVENDVLEKIAMCSDGGLRDALGLLDKLISYTDEKITLDDLNNVYGLVSMDYVQHFLELIQKKDLLEILNQINKIYEDGKDLIIFCQDLMELLRDDLICYYTEQKNNYSVDFDLLLVQYLNSLIFNMKNSDNVKIVFEIGILGFINSKSDKSQKNDEIENYSSVEKPQIISREIISTEEVEKTVGIEEIKKKNSTEIAEKSIISKDKPSIDHNFQIRLQKYEDLKKKYINNTFATANKDHLIKIKAKWDQFSEYTFDKEYGAVACYLIDSTVRAVGEHHMIITVNYDSGVQRGLQMLSKLEQLISKVVEIEYHLAILSGDEWEEERKEFIERKKNNIPYLYQEDDLSLKEKPNTEELLPDSSQEIDDSSDTVAEKAIKIFGKEVVKVN